MKIKHYGYFRNPMNVLNWEVLRNDETEQPYYLPFKKDEYLKKVDVMEPSYVTQKIIDELKQRGLSKVFSIGSGIASLEYQLKKFSDLIIAVSDYNSTVLRLKEFGVFDDVFIIDALKEDIPVDDNWVVLFPRIDTEFEDHQLEELFKKCSLAGVRYICFVPAELLSFKKILGEIKVLILSLLKRKPRVFCGYVRSFNSFVSIWGKYYKSIKREKNIIILNAI